MSGISKNDPEAFEELKTKYNKYIEEVEG